MRQLSWICLDKYSLFGFANERLKIWKLKKIVSNLFESGLARWPPTTFHRSSNHACAWHRKQSVLIAFVGPKKTMRMLLFWACFCLVRRRKRKMQDFGVRSALTAVWVIGVYRHQVCCHFSIWNFQSFLSSCCDGFTIFQKIIHLQKKLTTNSYQNKKENRNSRISLHPEAEKAIGSTRGAVRLIFQSKNVQTGDLSKKGNA